MIFTFFTGLFYISTIFYILQEIRWICFPIIATESSKKFSELTKEHKGKKWKQYSEEYQELIKSKLWSVSTLFWMLIGLGTFQWVAFLINLLFNLFIIVPLSKLTQFNFAYTILHWLNSILGLAFCLFVIINHYHLKIDLTQWVMSFFN